MKTTFLKAFNVATKLSLCRVDMVPDEPTKYTEIGTGIANGIESILLDSTRYGIMRALPKALAKTYRWNPKLMRSEYALEESEWFKNPPSLIGFVVLMDARAYSIWTTGSVHIEKDSKRDGQIFAAPVTLGDANSKRYFMFGEVDSVDLYPSVRLNQEFPNIDVITGLLSDGSNTYTRFRGELRRWNKMVYDKYQLKMCETDRRVLSFIFFPDNL